MRHYILHRSPVDLDELRAGIDDPDIWAQEYLCAFIDSSSVLLPYDLIAACEAPGALAAPGDAPRFGDGHSDRAAALALLLHAAARRGAFFLPRLFPHPARFADAY